jgi:pyridoxine 5-phosphate synthase
MAVTPAMVAFAEQLRPADTCFVPEKREELTTEGGLDVVAHEAKVTDAVRTLQGCGVQVSLFIDPVKAQIECAKRTGAHAIEIHTGSFCNANASIREKERAEIVNAASLAARLGLEVHAGHGLDYENVLPIAQIPEIVELNIGHSIIARAVIVGIEQAVREMKEVLLRARP